MCDDLHERHGDVLSCDPVYSYVILGLYTP